MGILKKFAIFVFIVSLPFLLVSFVHAAYYSIDSQGVLSRNSSGQVLSKDSDSEDDEDKDEDKTSEISVTSETENKEKEEEKEQEDEDDDQASNSGSLQRERLKLKFEAEGDDGKSQLKISAKNGKIELKGKSSGQFTSPGLSSESAEQVEVSMHENTFKIKIKARGDELEIEQKGIGALTHFPISIGAENELIITTPAGIKIVTILPDQAVQHILQSNIMDRVLAFRAAQASPSASPIVSPSTEASASAVPGTSPEASSEAELESPEPVASGVAEVEETEEIELIEVEGTLAYKIKGAKNFKLAGVVPVTAFITAQVSAETGEVISVEQPWYIRFLPFLFFSEA